MKKNDKNCEESVLTDLLINEKGLVKLYATALTEMSENRLRTMVKKHLADVSDDQYRVFCSMQKKGLYEVKPAPKQKIDETVQKFSEKVNAQG